MKKTSSTRQTWILCRQLKFLNPLTLHRLMYTGLGGRALPRHRSCGRAQLITDFRIATQRGLIVGIALGSACGSPGELNGVGNGVGISSGVSTIPLFVCNTPPESITSSTR